MKRASIVLEEYDPSWPSKLEDERSRLIAIAGEWCHGGIEHESPLWNERIKFRNFLSLDERIASDYARLKRDLATYHQQDRETYFGFK
ncbi:GrpB family protein [Marinimicrobium locisalis]|uniref:GrpB family protein n=1 Tax=Marinimicrobium locisalis TaxID=546022 RepID=UPI003D2FF626